MIKAFNVNVIEMDDSILANIATVFLEKMPCTL